MSFNWQIFTPAPAVQPTRSTASTEDGAQRCGVLTHSQTHTITRWLLLARLWPCEQMMEHTVFPEEGPGFHSVLRLAGGRGRSAACSHFLIWTGTGWCSDVVEKSILGDLPVTNVWGEYFSFFFWSICFLDFSSCWVLVETSFLCCFIHDLVIFYITWFSIALTDSRTGTKVTSF